MSRKRQVREERANQWGETVQAREGLVDPGLKGSGSSAGIRTPGCSSPRPQGPDTKEAHPGKVQVVGSRSNSQREAGRGAPSLQGRECVRTCS